MEECYFQFSITRYRDKNYSLENYFVHFEPAETLKNFLGIKKKIGHNNHITQYFAVLNCVLILSSAVLHAVPIKFSSAIRLLHDV